MGVYNILQDRQFYPLSCKVLYQNLKKKAFIADR